jgi:hypothetical protein
MMIRRSVWTQFLMAVVGFTGCTEFAGDSYLTERREVLRNDSKVNVVSIFPVIISSKSDLRIDSLNRFLKNVNHLDKLIKKDFNTEDEKVSVIGNYSILSNSENVVCLEFLVSVSIKNKKIYKPIFIDLNKKRRIDPDDVFEINDTRELLPYIKEFCDSTRVEINVSIYERNDETALVYGITDDKVILYLGGEGEDYGNYRISIPIVNLRHQ